MRRRLVSALKSATDSIVMLTAGSALTHESHVRIAAVQNAVMKRYMSHRGLRLSSNVAARTPDNRFIAAPAKAPSK